MTRTTNETSEPNSQDRPTASNAWNQLASFLGHNVLYVLERTWYKLRALIADMELDGSSQG